MKFRPIGLCLIVVALNCGQVKAGDSEYPFKKSPIEILEAIKSLPFPGPEPTFVPGEAEAQLIEWFRKGELTERQWVEAFLIADGVSKADDRLILLKEFDKSAVQLQIETKGMNAREKGDHILQYLHKGPMSAGFEREQSTFTELLRTAKYNCNASTIMFHLHAKRLGLKVQPAEFAGEHILDLVLLDDKIIDVETNLPDGFDSRAKNGQGQDDLNKAMRLTDAELLLNAFYNRLREAYRKDAKADVLRLLVVMLAIAPDDVDIQKGVEGNMIGWTYSLNKDGRHKEAMDVGRVQLEIAPNSSGIKNLSENPGGS